MQKSGGTSDCDLPVVLIAIHVLFPFVKGLIAHRPPILGRPI